ncbi:MAG: ABC transporter substrate-binding protein, partial [Rhizobium sp.]|nr:ABC transporter substrate-binding protein [Rhizobium sp.]
MKKLFASTILAAALYALPGAAQAAECGEVTIAEMNWASAGVAAHVDKIILEAGYGCDVTLVTGDT